MCGGIHVENTANIGSFYIIKESGVSSGVRRIEAVCGKAAYEYGKKALVEIAKAKEELKSQDLLEGIKKQKEQIKSLKSQSTTKATTQNLQIEDINGVCVIIQSVDDIEMKTLVDNAKNKYEKVAILLIDTQGKIVAGVKNTTIKAGSWVKEVAQVMGGNGGGRDDFATAGGKDTQKIKEALQRAREIVLESI